MMETPLVTKKEALTQVVHLINKPGAVDLNVFIELLTWERKLLFWLLKESKQEGTLEELIPELSAELTGALRERQEAVQENKQ